MPGLNLLGTLFVVAFFGLKVAAAQLPAPTAISDAGFSQCSRDFCLFVPDDQHPHVYRHDDLEYSVQESGLFIMRRMGKVLVSTELKDLSASVYVVWSADGRWFAITWSDGGAIGNFHTRLFNVAADRISETHPVEKPFADFQSRHYCKARGDNVQAYRWQRATGGIVLVMSVYPTGDCGKDSGHTEGYLVDPEDGHVLRHFTATQLRTYIKMNPVP